MSNKFDNKRLIYILAALVVVLILTLLLKVPGKNATLRSNIVEFDTAAVDKIIMIPKPAEGEPFEFVRNKGRWTIGQGEIISRPVEWAVPNILDQLVSLRPKSLEAVDESKWEEFELTDSLATRIKLLSSKGKILADLMIGKFTYSQSQNPYNPYGGGNVEGTSYVRNYGEKEIYSVDGFLAINFSGTFSDWRDKSMIRCNREDLYKITYTYPGNSSYTLIKDNNKWYANNMEADSVIVTNYLTILSRADGQEFMDGYTPDKDPLFLVNAEGNNLTNFTIKCYEGEEEGKYILNSSLNPDVYFLNEKETVLNDIFVPWSHFMKK